MEDLTSCKAQIEKVLAKLRWSMSHQAESEPDGEGEEEVEGRQRVWPVDLETKSVNLRYLRPTDLPFNRQVCSPDALESGKEIDMQHLKGRLLRATKEYIADRSMGSIGSNLMTEEHQGANKDIVVYQKDKSGRFAVDNLGNYRVACQPHVENEFTVRSEAELRDLGLPRFCPRRKTNRGRPPTITGCAVDENKTKRFHPWLPPVEQPDEVTTRKMCTDTMKIVLLFIMQNHLYTFDNEIKLQSEGGPIGLELTGVLAQLFMV